MVSSLAPGLSNRLRILAASAVFLICRGTIAPAQSQQITAANVLPGAASAEAPAFAAKELAAPPAQNWLKNGGSLLNQNYSPLKQINRENVGMLKAVWQTHLQGSGLAMKYSGEAQPVVYQGVIYIVTGADDVFALNVKTGAIVWK